MTYYYVICAYSVYTSKQFFTVVADIRDASHILIAVPKSLTEDKQVDMTFLHQAIATVEEHA
ncbi:predicted protein [Plenodomus lingam JN3]|uniref:Predicted protein n=1 Tax=Leptosphaeria maculans (strain JN3 / isolate v23.1.3 / race Av1-4-5-6-7-8) TaxID=985895 RepID=E4ZZ35_LEPMJ|nr:predicted protein [Plenodomus lingam JN3]CBX96470.1 predicted protein [Plenodomus lingam JN3]